MILVIDHVNISISGIVQSSIMMAIDDRYFHSQKGNSFTQEKYFFLQMSLLVIYQFTAYNAFF